jgi:hypothetical protein
MTRLIYCINCVHCIQITNIIEYTTLAANYRGFICAHPYNLEDELEHPLTPLKVEIVSYHIKNKTNDCKDYKELDESQ